MTILASTNVLLRLARPNHRQYQAATEGITPARLSGEALYPESSASALKIAAFSIGGMRGGQTPLAPVPARTRATRHFWRESCEEDPSRVATG